MIAEFFARNYDGRVFYTFSDCIEFSWCKILVEFFHTSGLLGVLSLIGIEVCKKFFCITSAILNLRFNVVLSVVLFMHRMAYNIIISSLFS